MSEREKSVFWVLRELGYEPAQSRKLIKALSDAGYKIKKAGTVTEIASKAIVELLEKNNLEIVRRPDDDSEDRFFGLDIDDFKDRTECRECGVSLGRTIPAMSMHGGMCGGDFCQHDQAYLTGD